MDAIVDGECLAGIFRALAVSSTGRMECSRVFNGRQRSLKM